MYLLLKKRYSIMPIIAKITLPILWEYYKYNLHRYEKNMPFRVIPYQNTSKCTILIKFCKLSDISGHSFGRHLLLIFEHMKSSPEMQLL